MLQPAQKLLFIALHASPQTGQDDRVEFKALRLVNGHDLQPGIRFGVGSGKEGLEPAGQLGNRKQVAPLFHPGQDIEELARILYPLGIDAGRPADSLPGRFHQSRQRGLATTAAGLPENRQNPFESLLSVAADYGEHLLLLR